VIRGDGSVLLRKVRMGGHQSGDLRCSGSMFGVSAGGGGRFRGEALDAGTGWSRR
jgi:hypothetical protein